MNTNKGFTLIELLVTITIICVLSIGAASAYTSSLKRTRDAQSISNAGEIGKALELYYSINNSYPANLSLFTSDPNVPYFKTNKVPTDPIYGGEFGIDLNAGVSSKYSQLSSGGKFCLCSGKLNQSVGNADDSSCGGLSSDRKDGAFYCVQSLQ